MKKYIISLAALCFAGLANGQTYEDALKFSQNIYEGTARFQGTGGAFAALGGDFTTLSINPAGVAIFRSSELTVTSSLSILSTNTNYLQSTAQENKTRLLLSNIGYVASFIARNTDGLVGINIGVGANVVQNTTQRIFGKTTTNRASFAQSIAEGMTGLDYREITDKGSWLEQMAYDSWLVDTIPGKTNEYIADTEDNNLQIMGPLNQSYYRDQSGYVTEYPFSIGVNWSNAYFFGITLGIQDIDNNLYEEFNENAVHSSDFGGWFAGNLRHDMDCRTSGTGYNLKLGTILLPAEGLRIGAYVHTPTWMYLTDEWLERFSYDNYREERDGIFDYRIITPFKWGIGLAYTFGSYGLLSVDYEGADFSGARMYGEDKRDRHMFQQENDYIGSYCRTTSNIRAGGEFRIDNFTVRGGYSFYQNPEKGLPDTHIGSVGMGLRWSSFFMDMAYSFIPNLKKDYSYYGSPYMYTDTFYNKILLTLGFRF